MLSLKPSAKEGYDVEMGLDLFVGLCKLSRRQP